MTSFTYKNVGVNLDIEPRVTYDGEIIMKLTLEVSAQGSDRNVAGQNLPAFSTRKVETRLRLRDGESNLLAGLLREDERKSLKGFPGAIKVPVLKQLFSANDNQIAQTDIVMLLTPHIVRTHEMTQKDFAPIYIGTQQNLGLSGPPPLIQPQSEPAQPQPPAVGAPGQPIGSAVPATRLPASVPVPGMLPVTPPTTAPAPAAAAVTPSTTAPAPAAPAVTAVPAEPPPAPPAVAEPPAAAQAAVAQPAAAAPAPVAADNLRIVLTPPSTPVTVAGGAVTVPISVFGASRMSTVTLSLRFDPKVLRVRLVQQGTFLSAAAGSVTLAHQVDAAAGRLDVTLTRSSDTTGVSGDGVLATVVFDTVGAGVSSLGLGGVVTNPGGLPIPAQFGQASITVR
jgi:general secretion pathway protein D